MGSYNMEWGSNEAPHVSCKSYGEKEDLFHGPAPVDLGMRWRWGVAAPGSALIDAPFLCTSLPSLLSGDPGVTVWGHPQHQDPTLGNCPEAGTRPREQGHSYHTQGDLWTQE